MKKFLTLLFSGMMIFALATNAFAATNEQTQKIGEVNDDSNFAVVAVMTNQETGEKTPIDVEYSIMPTTQLSSKSDGGNYDAEVTATFKLPAPTIQPLITDTKVLDTDVKATLSINYDRSGSKIRVNRVFGSWVPANSQIYLNNREVHYSDGVPIVGKRGHKYPTKNSFSYTTNWDWVEWYPVVDDAASGAGAFSAATVAVTGMSPHTIELRVTATQ